MNLLLDDSSYLLVDQVEVGAVQIRFKMCRLLDNSYSVVYKMSKVAVNT